MKQIHIKMKTSNLKLIHKNAVLFVLLFFMFSQSLNAFSNLPVTIRGVIKELNNGDTVTLIRYKHQFILPNSENEIKSYAVVKDNIFSFTTALSVKIEKCQIIFPNRLAHLNWKNGFIESGYDLDVRIKNNKLDFAGRGYNLIRYSILLDSIYRSFAVNFDWKGENMKSNLQIAEAAIAKIQQADLTGVENNNVGFSILRLDKSLSLIGVLYTIANRINGPAKGFMRTIDNDVYKRYLKDLLSNNDVIEVPASSFGSLVRSRYDCLFGDTKNGIQDFSTLQGHNAYIKYLKGNFKDPQLAQLLVAHLYRIRNSDILTQNLIDSVFEHSNFNNYKSLVEDIRKILPGNIIPEFSLLDSKGNGISLNKFKGNVLLLDFWFTGCGACVLSHKIVAPIMKSFEGKSLKLISISKDAKRDTWIKSIHSGLYSDPSNINLFAGKEGELHPLFKYFEIYGYPTFILIGKDGRIIGSPTSPLMDQGVDLKAKISKALKSGL